MKDLSKLKHRIQAKTLDLVTQRNGASVYQGQSSQGEVFIKIANIQTANDRYCEILEALKEFPLTPKVLNKFEWEGSSILVISAIEGTQVDQALKNCCFHNTQCVDKPSRSCQNLIFNMRVCGSAR